MPRFGPRYRFAEIYYRRAESGARRSGLPVAVGSLSTTSTTSSTPSCSTTTNLCTRDGRVETTVLFLPDVWNISPTKLEWDGLHLNYKRQLDRKLTTLAGGVVVKEEVMDVPDEEDEDVDQALPLIFLLSPISLFSIKYFFHSL